MLFNITNGPEPYIMRAVDLEVGAVAVAAIGMGSLGLEEIGGDRSGVVPIFTNANGLEPDTWFNKHFGRSFNDTLNRVATSRQEELVKALSSVFLGTPSAKLAFDELAKLCPDEESYVILQLNMHDSKRTSDNDIGRRAWNLARGIVQAELIKAEAEAAGATIQ